MRIIRTNKYAENEGITKSPIDEPYNKIELDKDTISLKDILERLDMLSSKFWSATDFHKANPSLHKELREEFSYITGDLSVLLQKQVMQQRQTANNPQI